MDKLKNLFKDNGVAILKADTVWGIFARISEQNRQRINMIKQSSMGKIMSIAFADIGQAKEYVDEEHHKFLTGYPGKITKIVKSSNKLKEILPLYKYVGVRIMDRTELNEIIKEVGPLFTTSANITGESTPKESTRLEMIFKTEVDFIEEGVIENTKPSKIYSYIDGEEKRIR